VGRQVKKVEETSQKEGRARETKPLITHAIIIKAIKKMYYLKTGSTYPYMKNISFF